MHERAPLLTILDAGLSHGGLQSDDVLALLLPLLREVAALHEQGRVAELDGPHAYLRLATGGLGLLRPQGVAPTDQRAAVERLQAPVTSVLRIIGERRVTVDGEDGVAVQDLGVAPAQPDTDPARPQYLPGYVAWERRLGHHDALTDILCLGQVLASLACGLDFTDADDLALFAGHRDNLFRLQQRLHPVIGAVILEMTELNRHRRARDLPSQIRRLESYREQSVDAGLAGAAGAADGVQAQRRAVQTHLRDRLFDLSRRNRLLHFKPTQATANLTVASVPLVVDLNSIRADQLCVWGGRFAEEVLSGDKLALARWLRFEDQPYLPGALDHIIQDARRDRAEYGFSQLSLVVAFLRWHNLKDERDERVSSPLLLLPVQLSRKKGVRDQYVMQADTTEAQVNPVLRQHLRQLYGIALPESVDLRAASIGQFHQDLQRQIAATEPGVQLRLITEPQIELIHQRARQRLEQFRRRQRIRPAAPVAVRHGDYSYSRDDFRPLGLQLFHQRVRPDALPLRGAAGGRPEPRHPRMAADVAESATFALREGQGNPYQWDLDLTSVTLGNFNYRKMSLVRDYAAMLDNDLVNPAFDRVFSLQPRALDLEPLAPLPRGEQWAVVPADATQTSAVALARTGASYIIQGPPGTGKSQTITNLIADYVGRGKRVLFVCEKRAAIDVVFHRLQQQGLDELCCMIHDSQADKKDFVHNLKQTYEQWLGADEQLDAVRRERQALVAGIDQDQQALQRFDAAMRAAPADIGLSVRELVHRLVALRGRDAVLTPAQREALPAYAAWQRRAELVQRLHGTLRECAGVDSLAQHVFAQLGPRLIAAERPLSRLVELVDQAEALLDRCSEAWAAALAGATPPPAAPLRLRELLAVVDHAQRGAALAANGQLALLDPASELSRQFDALRAVESGLAHALAQAGEPTRPWKAKLGLSDARHALEQLERQEGSLLRWLQPSWWRLRGELERRYDFSQHVVRPTLRQVVGALIAEHQAGAALEQAQADIRVRFATGDGAGLAAALQALRGEAAADPVLALFQRQLLASASAAAVVAALAALAADAGKLAEVLDELLPAAADATLDALGETVRDLREHADLLPELLPLLRELGDADARLAQTLRTLPLAPAELEYAIARESLEQVYRRERWLPRFDGAALARHAGRLDTAERALLTHNALAIRAAVRHNFRLNVQRSSLSASQLDAEGKLFKKAYSAGRRELEHEFGKSMRYKAIRELASADSGRVVRDMKPVWLMSPLSVSDTLPLAPDLFDVVIFDEASQIPMEEAVPALYRAPQVIVVGDEMQLPPTSFFSSARGDGEDVLAVDDHGERLALALDADSLLNQGARNLPATLLAWHYRSRHESLIGFSNAAFYAGKLYTIPDRRLPPPDLGDIEVSGAQLAQDVAAGHAALHAQALLARAISFHHLGEAVYANRRNEDEARHIALMVRELLARETGRSIGIVAFSEAQQDEIEAALDELAAGDTAFGAQLEAEHVREEDGQFCGLFVKNLENVQGDERDIIILSICYGRNPEGRMLMNFGPINQRGGEKRLNVIFSRARHHMAVVSSIRHEAITNDYNEGAAALKQFLRYAECASRGDHQTAQRVLENLNPLARSALADDGVRDEVTQQLLAALRARGHVVDARVGQSRFRCDLAIRDGGQYALGILVDTAAHYANRDVVERYVSRPRILRAFGWRTLQVIASDWLHDSMAVLDRVERALREVDQARPEPEAEAVSADDVALERLPEPADSAVADDTPPAMTRRFECVDGTARKFWSICCSGGDVSVTFGRIGTQGQTQLKQFASADRARLEMDKLVAEKLRKGYQETA